MPPKRREQPPPPESESESEASDMNEQGMFDESDFDPNFDKKFLAKLNPVVRERVAVLQAQDKKLSELSEEHDKAVLALRRKYAELAKPLFAKRRELVDGSRDPTDEEVAAGYPEEHKGVVSLTEGPASTGKKGIPSFWSQALHHHVIIDEMITEKDDEAMESLTDITVDLLPEGSLGFTISFHFAPNDFFTNAVVSKTFHLKELADEYVLEKATGTDIQWKQGKNLGINIISKKQKNKKGQVRYVTKEEPCQTFFDFFKNGLPEEEEEQYHAMAETLKDKIVPRAVDYYTGEAPNGDSDMEGGDDEEGEEDEEDDEAEESEEEPPARARGRGRGAAPAPGAGRGGRGAAPPADCKQQ